MGKQEIVFSRNQAKYVPYKARTTQLFREKQLHPPENWVYKQWHSRARGERRTTKVQIKQTSSPQILQSRQEDHKQAGPNSLGSNWLAQNHLSPRSSRPATIILKRAKQELDFCLSNGSETKTSLRGNGWSW